MKIRYAGTSTVRQFAQYQFDRTNGYTREVAELGLIQEMLTQPGVDFVVAGDDPLALLVGVDRAAELVLDGIMTIEQYEATQTSEPPKTRGHKIFREEVGYPTEEM